MTNKRLIQLKLAGSIFLGLMVLVAYVFIISGSDVRQMVNEFDLITKQKDTVTGKIIYAKQFEEEVETNDSRTIKTVQGYSYTYQFRTLDKQEIQSNSGNYGKLPFKKTIADIPYEVQIEYLKENPNLNRIKNLWSNNKTLFEWFRHQVLYKLIGLAFCLFITYKIIRTAVDRYKTERRTAANSALALSGGHISEG